MNCWPTRHRARKRRRDGIFFEDNPQLKGASRAHPQKRRRFQLHDHRPGDAGLPAGNVAAGRNHLRHRRPAAIAFPAALRRVPQMACRIPRKLRSAKLAHVWFRLDSRRGRQAVQNALRRDGETRRFARRGRRTRLQNRFRKKSRIAGSAARKSRASSASAR
jgi:hypothetical protein